MKQFIFAAVCSVVLAGCATYQHVPENYAGPVVTIADSAFALTSAKGMLFYVESIDGNPVRNARNATAQSSYGQGFRLTTGIAHRQVRVVPMKLKIVGTHVTAAPIHELASRAAGEFFTVSGEVDFTPVAGRRYVVDGELTKQLASVWVRDAETGQPVTEKITAR